MRHFLKMTALLFLILFILPLFASAMIYGLKGRHVDWRLADRASTRLLPPAAQMHAAVIRVFSARTVSWRGIFATHSWIVIKDPNASAYERFDYTAWGSPIWKDRFVPDARWFGNAPEVVFALDGTAAERMMPAIRATIGDYRYSHPGDYRLWPGPNSNTFVAAVMQAAAMQASLPATAVGKDFPYDGRWLGMTPSRTGVRLNLGGYLGISLGWVEGFEINVLGAVAGLDIRRPALKLPGLGRLGMPSYTPPAASTEVPASIR